MGSANRLWNILPEWNIFYYICLLLFEVTWDELRSSKAYHAQTCNLHYILYLCSDLLCIERNGNTVPRKWLLRWQCGTIVFQTAICVLRYFHAISQTTWTLFLLNYQRKIIWTIQLLLSNETRISRVNRKCINAWFQLTWYILIRFLEEVLSINQIFE